ncbi:hypothetical protein L4G92_03195 [Neisseria sp. ZJ106]|uniref:Uncharacterized protein n=1 Tax=Neisseria lisongii TaxID=2912188 RepID=A0ABY7RP17_9NEIS|nr:hypothetical protein [Neisseria lisongii]MCF7521060.1 hypothetical protein [Neisseria lisongii]WCL71990.1 hypothetical protein PJU73_02415 [Neisseria lisongii]
MENIRPYFNRKNNMKILKSILPALMVSSSLIFLSPSASAEPKQNSATAEQADRMYIADKVGQNDLYGFWGDAEANEEGSLINTTAMYPDGTGVDIMLLTVKAEGKPIIIKQEFTWTFDEKRQALQQTIADYRVVKDGREQQDKKEIGKKSTAKVKMLVVDNKPGMLELTDEESGDRMTYLKQDLEKFLNTLEDTVQKP